MKIFIDLSFSAWNRNSVMIETKKKGRTRSHWWQTKGKKVTRSRRWSARVYEADRRWVLDEISPLVGDESSWWFAPRMLACTMTGSSMLERRREGPDEAASSPPPNPLSPPHRVAPSTFAVRVRFELACQSALASNFLHAIARYWNCLVGDLSPSVIYFLNRAYLPTSTCPADWLPDWLAAWLTDCSTDSRIHVCVPRGTHTSTNKYVYSRFCITQNFPTFSIDPR